MAVIEYLQQLEPLTAAPLLTDMLKAAGSTDQLAVAQWLRQRGAEWPARLQYGIEQWRGATLTWARSEGCTSPEPYT
jgi:hypothetical protein